MPTMKTADFSITCPYVCLPHQLIGITCPTNMIDITCPTNMIAITYPTIANYNHNNCDSAITAVETRINDTSNKGQHTTST